jgi:phosphoribosyl-ATP pyrophosphohydrolase
MKHISKEMLEKIQMLNHKSIQLNETKETEESYTLESMQKHAREIRSLFARKDSHWAIETGDLLVHCMKILVLNGYDLNEIFEKCVKRFETKIADELRGTHVRSS